MSPQEIWENIFSFSYTPSNAPNVEFVRGLYPNFGTEFAEIRPLFSWPEMEHVQRTGPEDTFIQIYSLVNEIHVDFHHYSVVECSYENRTGSPWTHEIASMMIRDPVSGLSYEAYSEFMMFSTPSPSGEGDEFINTTPTPSLFTHLCKSYYDLHYMMYLLDDPFCLLQIVYHETAEKIRTELLKLLFP